MSLFASKLIASVPVALRSTVVSVTLKLELIVRSTSGFVAVTAARFTTLVSPVAVIVLAAVSAPLSRIDVTVLKSRLPPAERFTPPSRSTVVTFVADRVVVADRLALKSAIAKSETAIEPVVAVCVPFTTSVSSRSAPPS